ncbi:MAG: Asp-tRNA(Asn)/Glu-tRNA(Gln) amidotransferase subunit GatB [Candidatus Woesearchaeota archaeon]
MTKIGLEIHVQLNTKSKIFCSCSTTGNDIPNSRTCVSCLGMPGSKPSLNKEVIMQALKIALALNCKISNEMFFSRKSYFYPDLPKNFQITQYEIPLATSGILDDIRIRRIHIEEDPGKLVHVDSTTLIDYNRSGIPLVEIVTEPDFKTSNEVRIFLNKLITILEYLDVYSRISEASLRADVNVSIPDGSRIEIKNVNGIKEVEKAIEYEIQRQKKDIPKEQETRSWDTIKQKTFLLRTKETEEDYGYIFEPDLTKIELSKELIEKIKSELPELAFDKLERFTKYLKIKEGDAKALTADILLADLFEKVSKKVNPELAAKWIRRELPRVLHYNKKTMKDIQIDETHMIELLNLLETGQITNTTAQRIIEKLIEKPFSVKDYVKKEGLLILNKEDELRKVCSEILKDNPKALNDYKLGEQKALDFIIGKVMAKTKGTSDPNLVRKILLELIKQF